jgi:hypothetical protein
MYPFSPIALQQLHDAGWTDDRRIDISDYERKIRELGIELFPCVRDFLTQFGNLEFTQTRRIVKRPGWAPFGIPLVPITYGETTREWFNTRMIDLEPGYLEDDRYWEGTLGLSLQRIGRLDVEPSRCGITADSAGRVYADHDGALGLLGTSIYDGMEAILSDRPDIECWAGNKKDWRKLSKAAKWREYVERTGIMPPDEVFSLLIPDAQEAIREAARR